MTDTPAFRKLFVGTLVLAIAFVVLLTAWLLWGRAWLAAKPSQPKSPAVQVPTIPSPTSLVGWNLKTLKTSMQKTETGFIISVSGIYTCEARDCIIIFGTGEPDRGLPLGKPLDADQTDGTFTFSESVTGSAPIDWYVDMVQKETGERMALTSGTLEPGREEP